MNDVIVVGAGGSGLAAAVSAAEAGCSVLVLEKCPQPGGTTGIAVGSFTGCGTSLQQKAGIDDTPEDHAEDCAKFAPRKIEAKNNDAYRKWFLAQTAETYDWLREMGLSFHGPNPEPPNRVPRMHNVVPGAQAYVAALQAKLVRLGGQILCGQTVTALLRDEEDRVTGVVANGEKLESRLGVVLAAGDYANNPEMIAKHKSDRFAAVEGINPHATGDGHRLAEGVGAHTLNMDVTYGPELRFAPPLGKTVQQLLPAGGPLAKFMGWCLPLVPSFVMNAFIRRLLVTWQHPENALFDDGAILVNQEGARFCKETEWPDREISIANQSGKLAYILMDERLTKRYSAWPHFISTAPKIAYAYVKDYLRLRPDVAASGSLDEVAAKRKLPAEALRATVEASNLKGDEWALLGPVKAYFTTTEGGVSIDRSFRTLDEDGNPISGLFAVGQNGLGGQILWGHGLHIAWAMTSGRLVGKALGKLKAEQAHA